MATIPFCLIVNDFGTEYVGERHIHHLRDVLKQHNEIIEDWTGTKFGGINIKWDYAQKHAKRTCRLCIKDLATPMDISENASRLNILPRNSSRSTTYSQWSTMDGYILR